MAEESRAAWYREQKTLEWGHGNCPKVVWGRKQKQPQWRQDFASVLGKFSKLRTAKEWGKRLLPRDGLREVT